ncbi:nSTAND1 domain-containing NTPase [Streptomyces mirabilis]
MITTWCLDVHQRGRQNGRLVVLGSGGPETAEIAHETLIREWGRLSAWVEEDTVFQQWLAVMEERARDKDLLSATRVAEAQRWLGERRNDIPQGVADFTEHSSTVILKQQQTQEMLTARDSTAGERADLHEAVGSGLVIRRRQLRTTPPGRLRASGAWYGPVC